MSWLPGAILVTALAASLGYFLFHFGRGIWTILVKNEYPASMLEQQRRRHRNMMEQDSAGIDTVGE